MVGVRSQSAGSGENMTPHENCCQQCSERIRENNRLQRNAIAWFCGVLAAVLAAPVVAPLIEQVMR